MKLLLIILTALAALGTLYEVPADKFTDLVTAKVERHDEPALIAQCGTMQYGYGAGDCAASSYGAYQAFGAECAASPSQYSGYGMPYGAPRYSYAPAYSVPTYGGYYAQPTYYYPARPAYGYGYAPSYGFRFGVGWGY